MFRAAQGAAVLLLLSAFFAYILVPIVALIRLKVRVGPRRIRPSTTAVVGVPYCVLFAAAFLVWRTAAPRAKQVVAVSAPAAIDRLFAGGTVQPIDSLVARAPVGLQFQSLLSSGTHQIAAYLEREVRRTFDDMLAASRYVHWLAVVPLVAFFLMTAAPQFRRSADRLMPHGHLQWRTGEYLRDINSALAGYVRAQLAAGLIVATACSIGFALLRLPDAFAMGIVAGILELVPAIGPVVVLLMATSQAEGSALPVVVFLAGLRVLQDYVIYPRLIRHGMHMATPFVLLAIWGGAALAGAAGVILAMPIAGLLSVSLRHWQEYRAIERVVREYGRG